jgi:cobalamin biosynthetic protein CobC
LSEALSETPDVIVVVNPNNPDGRVVPEADLQQAAAILSRRDGWLVIDEAFADLEVAVSMAHRDLPATIILRSFGKTYGLAGIRLGFAIAADEFTKAIRDHLGLWAISGPALEIGTRALADRGWIEAQGELLRAAARDLDCLLISRGFEIVGGTLLFRLARHPEARSLFERLARAGIWVRRFPHDPAILRFGIPPQNAFERLQSAI